MSRVSTPLRTWECDIVLSDMGWIVEYDGNYWHAGREEHDRMKSAALSDSGWHVIRVRERPLRQVGQFDVCVDPGDDIKAIADRVLVQLAECGAIEFADVSSYLQLEETQATDSADLEFNRLRESHSRPRLSR